MASIKLSPNNFLRNTAKSSNKIKLKIVGGIVNGNIGEVITPPTADASLDFSSENNSQYIPVI